MLHPGIVYDITAEQRKARLAQVATIGWEPEAGRGHPNAGREPPTRRAGGSGGRLS